jgi:hypothetical protein
VLDGVDRGGHAVGVVALAVLARAATATAVAVCGRAGDAENDRGRSGGDGQQRTRGQAPAGAAPWAREKCKPNSTAPKGLVLHVPCRENS